MQGHACVCYCAGGISSMWPGLQQLGPAMLLMRRWLLAECHRGDCPAGLWPYFADTPALINSTSNQQIRPVRCPCCPVHRCNPDLTASAQCMQLQPCRVAHTVMQHQVRLHKLHAPAPIQQASLAAGPAASAGRCSCHTPVRSSSAMQPVSFTACRPVQPTQPSVMGAQATSASARSLGPCVLQ